MKRPFLLIFLVVFFSGSFAQKLAIEELKELRKKLDAVDRSSLSSPYLLNKGFLLESQLQPYHSIQDGQSSVIHMKPSLWKNTWRSLMLSSSTEKDLGKAKSEKYLAGYKELKSTVPIGIIEAKGDIIYQLGSRKQSVDQLEIFAASALKQLMLSSEVTFVLADDLVELHNSKIEDYEIDVSDGNGYRPLTSSFSTKYASVGEKAVAIRWNSPDGPVVSYSVIKVLYQEEPASDMLAKTSSIIGDDLLGLSTEIYLGCDGVFDRPVILIQGYDPFDSNTISEHTRPRFLEAGIDNAFRSNGYDMVYVDFDESTLDMRENAEFFRRLLDRINVAKVGTSPNIIIAVSMAGLISRYALNLKENSGAVSEHIEIFYPIQRDKVIEATEEIRSNSEIDNGLNVTMEATNRIVLSEGFHVSKESSFRATRKDVAFNGLVKGHNVSHFITFDTGHKGNNLPVGFQTLLYDDINAEDLFEIETFNLDEFTQRFDLLGKDASRQLLLRYRGPDPDPMHVEFQNELGDQFPQNGVRNISIISGAGNTTPQNVVPGQRIFEAQAKVGFGIKVSALDARIYSNVLNGTDKVSSFKVFGIGSTTRDTFDGLNHDIVSGGIEHVGIAIEDAANYGGDLLEAITSFLPGLDFDISANFHTSFTPVWSTIAYTGPRNTQDDISRDTQFVLANNLTPLDAIYAGPNNTTHARPTEIQAQWNQLLDVEFGVRNNLDCGDPPVPYIQVQENNLCENECAYLSLSPASNLGWTGTHTWEITGPVSDSGNGLTHVFCPEQPGVYTATITRSNTVDGVTTSESSSMTITFYDSSHPRYGCPDDIHLRVEPEEEVLAEELIPHESELFIWPNPVEDVIRFQMPIESAEQYTISVMTLEGKVVLSQEGDVTTLSSENELDVSVLPAGLYIVEYRSGELVNQSKFIKN